MEPSKLFCCFVFVVGTIFIFDIFPRYKNIYGITFLDNIDVINCANFGTSVTSTLQKQLKAI